MILIVQILNLRAHIRGEENFLAGIFIDRHMHRFGRADHLLAGVEEDVGEGKRRLADMINPHLDLN